MLFLLILGVAFIVSSSYYFLKLQLHIIKIILETILEALCLYLHYLKKYVSNFWNIKWNWMYIFVLCDVISVIHFQTK